MRQSFVFDIATSNGAAYSTGDAIGTTLVLSNCVSEALQSGVIKSVHIACKDNQTTSMDLLFFEEAPTAGVDNALFAVTNTDVLSSVAKLQISSGTFQLYNGKAFATVNPEYSFQLQKSKTMWAQLISIGTPTYTGTSNLRLKIVIEKD